MTINIRVQTSPSKDAIDLEGKIDTSKREDIEHLVEMLMTQHKRGNLIHGDLFWDTSNDKDIEHLVDSLDINLIKKEN